MSPSRKLAAYAPAVILFLVLTGGWEILAPIFKIPDILLPVPSHIGAALLDSAVNWPYHIAITAFEIGTGFIVAVIFGIALAVGMVMSPWLRRLLMPYVLLAQMIPKIAFAPIFFLVIGYNLLSSIVITFLVAFFPMVVDTAAGLSSLDPRMEDLLRSLQASRWDILRKAQFPKSLPFIFSGLKVSSTLAVIGATVAEFISAKAGLGFLIINAQVTFNAALAFAAAIYLILLGIVFYGLIDAAERFAMPWTRGARIH
jgi:NitT/TauT family transport system permease protein